MRTVLARPDHGLGAAGRAGRCPRPGAERPAGVELQDVSKVDTPPAPKCLRAAIHQRLRCQRPRAGALAANRGLTREAATRMHAAR